MTALLEAAVLRLGNALSQSPRLRGRTTPGRPDATRTRDLVHVPPLEQRLPPGAGPRCFLVDFLSGALRHGGMALSVWVKRKFCCCFTRGHGRGGGASGTIL